MINPIVEEDLKFIIKSNNFWSSFEGKNLLITGANGFLPAYMVETLLYLNENQFEEKTNVYALVRDEKKALERFYRYKNFKELNFIVQDVCKPLHINEKLHFIIHAASQASPKFYLKDPVGTLCTNVIGTYNLLKLAKKNKVESFLFFSSGEVYGEVNKDKIPIEEDSYGYLDPTDVRSCYGESKRMGETMCVSWFKQYGIPTKIIRPFHTYGPGMKLNDGRVFADFVANILKREDILMKSDGKSTRSFCYLADAVSAYFNILINGENAEPYNVGNDSGEISILNLAETLVKLFPDYNLKVIRKKRKDANYLESKIKRSSPDISKIRSIGWKPHYSVEKGFKRTVQSFEYNQK